MLEFLTMNASRIRKVSGVAGAGAILFGLVTLNVAAVTVGAVVLIALFQTK